MVLFDGSHLDEWEMASENGEVTWIWNDYDKTMTVHRTDGIKKAIIQTKKVFDSVQLHMEWKSPEEIKGDGQHRGDGGVYFQVRYEVQI